MKLRQWQQECIESALVKYHAGFRHFLALATPGAGKTIMASELAKRLLNRDLVDLVLCFSPSSIVAKDFSECLCLRTKQRFDGLIGAKGRSLTYQHLQHLDDSFWELFNSYRVFVIFDEIHHCAGSNLDNANAWGEQIILNIQHKARFTLALTGTPWRSDTAPIVLSNYLGESERISCDYIYGLSDAINNGVCRTPEIIAIDNSSITVVDGEETKCFKSFKALLLQSTIPYINIIENKEVMRFLLYSANRKISEIRQVNPDAAGLIVASSVEHAKEISILMQLELNEDSVIVTYKEREPTKLIQDFRNAESKWIISVGMISEGTNIPRLQVCCHLTNIKTEMHFRQTLGRILRTTSSINQEAVMFMPAEPKLLEYAQRVSKDMPAEADVVKFKDMKAKTLAPIRERTLSFDRHQYKINIDGLPSTSFAKSNITSEAHYLNTSYEKVVNIFGRFKQETIALGLSELR